MSLINLPTRCSHQTLIQALDEAGQAQRSANRVALYLPDGCFVSPCAMAFLGAWGLYLQSMGGGISVTGNDDTRRYLARMDLFQTLDIPYTENFERHNEAGRFVPMKLVQGDSCGSAVDAVCELVLHQFDNAGDFSPPWNGL